VQIKIIKEAMDADGDAVVTKHEFHRLLDAEL
jgi:hypothetical protein